MRRDELECGCVHGHDKRGAETIQMCETHEKEHSELHERAMIDYRKNHPLVDGVSQ